MLATKTPRRVSGIAALLTIPTLLLTLAACAPAADSESPNPTPSSGSEKLTRAQWQLKYAECMRGEGVDTPDPNANENGSVFVFGEDEIDPAALEAAADHCRAELGEPPVVTAEEQEAANQQFLKWGREVAECYRDNGFDMPDPKTGEELQFPSDAPDAVVDECGAGAGTVSGSVNQ